MKNIKNSAVAEKSLAAHRLLKIKSTEDKSYQISAENCLRKRDWYGLVHFSQRKRCGNAAETRNATSFCSYVFPPSGNVTETWTIRFPQDFRNTETPYFTLCAWGCLRQHRTFQRVDTARKNTPTSRALISLTRRQLSWTQRRSTKSSLSIATCKIQWIILYFKSHLLQIDGHTLAL